MITVTEHGDELEWPDHCVGVLDFVLVARVLYVNVIETHPTFQRRGVATALLSEASRRYPGRRPVHEGLSRSGLAWWETFGDPGGDWLEDHI